MEKICFKCGIKKDLNEFYSHPEMADGHLNKCISCTKNDSKNRIDKLKTNPDFIRKERERGRIKYHKYKYKSNSNTKKTRMNYKEKYPEKYMAKIASQRMKKIDKSNHFHHWSYNNEHFKDVIELSVREHNLLHRFMIYDQERKMYRNCMNGVLLDSKKSHLDLLNFAEENHDIF